MITTVTDAVKYITATINEVEKNEEPLDEIFVHETFMNALLDKIEELNISPEMLQTMEEHEDDEDYLNSYFADKIPNYYTIHNNLIQEVIADYLME